MIFTVSHLIAQHQPKLSAKLEFIHNNLIVNEKPLALLIIANDDDQTIFIDQNSIQTQTELLAQSNSIQAFDSGWYVGPARCPNPNRDLDRESTIAIKPKNVLIRVVQFGEIKESGMCLFICKLHFQVSYIDKIHEINWPFQTIISTIKIHVPPVVKNYNTIKP
jgi:hypothetical protein